MTYTQPEAIILQALCQVIGDAALTYPQAFPNMPAPDIPDLGFYLRVWDLRNTTARPFLNGITLFQGILQLTLSCPALVGTLPLLEEAGRLSSLFFSSPRIPVTGGHLLIPQRPSVVTMRSKDGARWEAPTSVNWRAYL